MPDDFRHLADAIPQLAWIADGSGAIFWYNRRWYDFTGTTLAEMRGRGWAKVHHPDHIRRVVESYDAAFAAGEAWEDTFPLRRHDGEFRWFLSRAEPVRDEAGAITRWFGTNTDITEARAAEATLRRSEERFRTLISASADLIWTASPDGGMIPPLPTWRAYTGQTEAEYAGWGWLDIVHPDDRDRVADLWRECLSSRAPLHVEFRLRRRDGVWRYCDVRAAPVMGPDGTVREWVGVNSDITERRDAEDAMLEAKDLAEGANRAKSQFIANMSHELRTPLSAVIGYSEMLAEEIEDVGQTHLLADVGKIEASARHLLGLINDVLDLSKIEAGRMTVESVGFDVAAMVQEVVSATEALVAKKNNRLEVDLGDDLGRMQSDELKIRQCLINLIGNAAKFTEDGLITLRARRDGPDRLSFDVVDTGIGMTPGAAEPPVPAVLAGRRIDDPAVRRHRARPRHHARLRPAPGRGRDGGERGGTRLHLPPPPRRRDAIRRWRGGRARGHRARGRDPAGRGRERARTASSWSTTTRRPATCWPGSSSAKASA